MNQTTHAVVSPPGHTVLPSRENDRGEFLSEGTKLRGPRWLIAIRPRPEKPTKLLFGAIADARLHFKRPIRVEISEQNETVAVNWPDIDEFGYGPNLSAALQDLSKTLAELFFSLNEMGARLSPHLENVRHKLGEFLELRPSR